MEISMQEGSSSENNGNRKIGDKPEEQQTQKKTGSEIIETDTNIIEFEFFETDDFEYSPVKSAGKDLSNDNEAEDVVDRIFDAATSGKTKDLSKLIFSSYCKDEDKIIGDLQNPRKRRLHYPLKRKSASEFTRLKSSKKLCRKTVDFKNIQNTLTTQGSSGEDFTDKSAENQDFTHKSGENQDWFSAKRKLQESNGHSVETSSPGISDKSLVNDKDQNAKSVPTTSTQSETTGPQSKQLPLLRIGPIEPNQPILVPATTPLTFLGKPKPSLPAASSAQNIPKQLPQNFYQYLSKTKAPLTSILPKTSENPTDNSTTSVNSGPNLLRNFQLPSIPELPQQRTVIDFSTLTRAVAQTIEKKLGVNDESDIKLVLFCNNDPIESFSILKNSASGESTRSFVLNKIPVENGPGGNKEVNKKQPETVQVTNSEHFGKPVKSYDRISIVDLGLNAKDSENTFVADKTVKRDKKQIAAGSKGGKSNSGKQSTVEKAISETKGEFKEIKIVYEVKGGSLIEKEVTAEKYVNEAVLEQLGNQTVRERPEKDISVHRKLQKAKEKLDEVTSRAKNKKKRTEEKPENESYADKDSEKRNSTNDNVKGWSDFQLNDDIKFDTSNLECLVSKADTADFVSIASKPDQLDRVQEDQKNLEESEPITDDPFVTYLKIEQGKLKKFDLGEILPKSAPSPLLKQGKYSVSLLSQGTKNQALKRSKTTHKNAQVQQGEKTNCGYLNPEVSDIPYSAGVVNSEGNSPESTNLDLNAIEDDDNKLIINESVEQCDVSDVEFDDLNKQNSNAGEELPFECDICFKVYRLRKYLNKHKLRVHRDQTEKAFSLFKHTSSRAAITKQIIREQSRQSFNELISDKAKEYRVIRPKVSSEEFNLTEIEGGPVSDNEEVFINTILNKDNIVSKLRNQEYKKYDNDDPQLNKVGDLQSLARIENQGEEAVIDPVFVCEYCGRFYCARKSLKDHFYREHATSPGQEPLYIFIATNSYNCPICFKSFTDPFQLVVHSKDHSNAEELKCVLCGKVYSSVYVLRRHIDSVHQEIRPRPFKCKYCDYAAANRWHLKEHLRKHTGEQPFKCPGCDKLFSHQGTMNRHCKTRHGILPGYPKRLFYPENVPEAQLSQISQVNQSPLEQAPGQSLVQVDTVDGGKPKYLSLVPVGPVISLKDLQTGRPSPESLPYTLIKTEPVDPEETSQYKGPDETLSPVERNIQFEDTAHVEKILPHSIVSYDNKEVKPGNFEIKTPVPLISVEKQGAASLIKSKEPSSPSSESKKPANITSSESKEPANITSSESQEQAVGTSSGSQKSVSSTSSESQISVTSTLSESQKSVTSTPSENQKSVNCTSSEGGKPVTSTTSEIKKVDALISSESKKFGISSSSECQEITATSTSSESGESAALTPREGEEQATSVSSQSQELASSKSREDQEPSTGTSPECEVPPTSASSESGESATLTSSKFKGQATGSSLECKRTSCKRKEPPTSTSPEGGVSAISTSSDSKDKATASSIACKDQSPCKHKKSSTSASSESAESATSTSSAGQEQVTPSLSTEGPEPASFASSESLELASGQSSSDSEELTTDKSIDSRDQTPSGSTKNRARSLSTSLKSRAKASPSAIKTRASALSRSIKTRASSSPSALIKTRAQVSPKLPENTTLLEPGTNPHMTRSKRKSVNIVVKEEPMDDWSV